MQSEIEPGVGKTACQECCALKRELKEYKQRLLESKLKFRELVKTLESLLEENVGEHLTRKRRKLNPAYAENEEEMSGTDRVELVASGVGKGELNEPTCTENEEKMIGCDCVRLVANGVRKSNEIPRHTLAVGGYLICLPPEILHKILAMLDYNDLISLAQTSHNVNSCVRGYVVTESGLNHLLGFYPSSLTDPESFSCDTCSTLADKTGWLLRVITVLGPTSSRLDVASHFLKKLLPRCRMKSKSKSSLGYCYVGQTLRILYRGWSYSEKAKVYSLSLSITKLERTMKLILVDSNHLGYHQWKEINVRDLHGQLFLNNNHQNKTEYAFWLFQSLKPWSGLTPTSLSKLFFLLRASTDEDSDDEFVPWNAPKDPYCLQPFTFPEALSAMYSNKELFGWTDDEIIHLINGMLFSDHQEWCLKSISELLVRCQPKEFAKNILQSWMKNLYYSVKDLPLLLYNIGITILIIPDGSDSEYYVSAYCKCFLSLLSQVKEFLPSQSSKKVIRDTFHLWEKKFSETVHKYKQRLKTERQMNAFRQDFDDDFSDAVYSAIDLCCYLALDKLEPQES